MKNICMGFVLGILVFGILGYGVPEPEIEVEPVVAAVAEVEPVETLQAFCYGAVIGRMQRLGYSYRWEVQEEKAFTPVKELSTGVKQTSGNKLLVADSTGKYERWEYICNDIPDSPFYTVPGPKLVRVNPVDDPLSAFE